MNKNNISRSFKRTLASIVVSTCLASSAIAHVTDSPTGEYILKVNTTTQTGQKLLADLKVDTVSTLFTEAGSIAIVVKADTQTAKQLANNQDVHYVEANGYQYFYQLQETDDAETREFSATQVELIKSLEHTEYTPYGITITNSDKTPEPTQANKNICIIDSGLAADHSDFAGVNIRGNHHEYSGFWDKDQVGHGTHVAGSIVAAENGTGVVGVIKNGNVNVYAQKLSNGEPGNRIRTSHTIEAMEVCASQGADVISMSYGGSRFYNSVNDVADRLYNNGVLLVAAAGNHGRAPGEDALHYPAAYHNVMSVGAIDRNKNRANFSAQNKDVEITGPGVNVLSTLASPEALLEAELNGKEADVAHVSGSNIDRLPTDSFTALACGTENCDDIKFDGQACILELGKHGLSAAANCQANGGIAGLIYHPAASSPIRLGTNNFDFPLISITNFDAEILKQGGQLSIEKTLTRYGYKSGTSMSTPHVSGIAAKVWSHFPHCTNDEIRRVLKHTAEDLGEPGKDIDHGAGLADTYAAYQWIEANGCATPKTQCADEWYFNQAYNKGDEVLLEGVRYQANYWNKDSKPSENQQAYGAWKNLGECTQ